MTTNIKVQGGTLDDWQLYYEGVPTDRPMVRQWASTPWMDAVDSGIDAVRAALVSMYQNLNRRVRMERETPGGKFNNLTDQMLYRLSIDGWCNESSGSTEAPTGWFARISISLAELPEVVDAFEEPMSGAGFVETESLIGHHLIIEAAADQLRVIAYDNERELQGDYRKLAAAYQAWAEGES